MKKIEIYYLEHNEIKLSDINCKNTKRKVTLRNMKKYSPNKNGKEEKNNLSALQKLCLETQKCTKCSLCKTRKTVVFGRGSETPDIVFVGEAPGADEDRLGEPFVGRAGKLLDKWLANIGLTIDKIYIMNAIKCRPPENRDPLPEEKKSCRDFFTEQLKLLSPKIICALGRHGFGNLVDFDMKEPFGKMRGILHYYGSIPVIATYHPAFILRSPQFESKALGDLEFLLRELDKIKS